MVSFESDYIAGAHPKVINKLIESNMESLSGYGSDRYTRSAIEKIRLACKKPDADVYFLVGGTQTNSVVISTLLDDCEGVIAAKTGHIGVHEAGAIEYTGHQVMLLPEHEGKICASELEAFIKAFYADANHEHMVYPGMVYISHPTEYGTLYTKDELEKISSICREFDIPLYMDGARLGYGLMSRCTDVSLECIANLCDAFYIGGTKVGALCGEALVFTGKFAPKHFVTKIKQHGALLAKGRLTGIQFDVLFTDDLYFEISRHAIDMAEQLKNILKEKNCRFFLESPTNQQFIIMEDEKLERIKEKLAYSFWEKYDDTHTVIRLATSWSTSDEDIEKIKEIL